MAETKLNTIEVLLSEALIDFYEFVSVNNVLKEYDMKEEIKYSNKYGWYNQTNTDKVTKKLYNNLVSY